jgi:hypothetical protein
MRARGRTSTANWQFITMRTPSPTRRNQRKIRSAARVGRYEQHQWPRAPGAWQLALSAFELGLLRGLQSPQTPIGVGKPTPDVAGTYRRETPRRSFYSRSRCRRRGFRGPGPTGPVCRRQRASSWGGSVSPCNIDLEEPITQRAGPRRVPSSPGPGARQRARRHYRITTILVWHGSTADC